MKTTLLAIFVILLEITLLRATTIAEWSFNSSISDTNPGTGTLAPLQGMGVARTIGGTTGSFASGVSADEAATGNADNSGWLTSQYPAGNVSNKNAGVEFMVDTSDFQGIKLSWFQRNSATASRYARVQYTTNGKDFHEADVIEISRDGLFTNISCDLSQTLGVSDNRSFGFRVVSEFEVTARGVGKTGYVATKTGSTYGVNGTVRFDLVTVSGTLIPGANTPPGLSGISNQVVRVAQATEPILLSIWDQEDPPDLLALKTTSSDPAVLPDQNLVLTGTGAERMLTIVAGDQPGTAQVTVFVVDTGGKKTSTRFNVTILPANTAPVISTIPRVDMVKGAGPKTVAFTVDDLEMPAERLTIAGQSGNPLLVPNSPNHLIFGGSGRDRTLTIIPAPGQTGVAPITVSVTDGTNRATSVFPVFVTPSESIVLYDDFDYVSGSLLTNSGYLWLNRSGALGECQVTNRQLKITSNQTEDVVSSLAGGPYSHGNSTVLYAGFELKLLSLPRTSTAYFAHFVGGGTLRGRIYLAASSALPGCFRLFVSNGTGAEVAMPANLRTNAVYKLISRYDIDSASTTLWVNPRAKTDLSVTASDPQSAVSITGYGFRQDVGLGADLLIDDLRVGFTFESVNSEDNGRLLIERGDTQVVLRWENTGMTLQRGPAPTGPFSDLPGASSPFVALVTNPAAFFRLRSHQ